MSDDLRVKFQSSDLILGKETEDEFSVTSWGLLQQSCGSPFWPRTLVLYCTIYARVRKLPLNSEKRSDFIIPSPIVCIGCQRTYSAFRVASHF